MTNITYAQALKILGLKRKPTAQELRTAYVSLAKKYHPDINPDPSAKEKIIRIINAKRVIERGESSDLSKFLNFKKEYQVLKSKLPPAATEFGPLQDAYANTARSKEFRDNNDNSEKLEMARQRLEQEIQFRQELRSRVKSQALKRLRRNLMTEEERRQEKVYKINQQLKVQAGKEQLKTNIHKRLEPITKKYRIIKSKVHLPFKDKKIVKYVLLTAGAIAAIATGRWAWNHRSQAYEPKLLTDRRASK